MKRIIYVLFFLVPLLVYAQKQKNLKNPKLHHKKYIPVSKNSQFKLSTEPVKISADSAAKLRKEVTTYASKFIGTRYKTGGQNPQGFDCSGYVSYTFRKFCIPLYTSAAYMFKQGREINLKDAQEGDIIFFTSTTSKDIGHVGIIVSSKGEDIRFIHSSSGKDYCVKFENLHPNYIKRYYGVKRVIEVF